MKARKEITLAIIIGLLIALVIAGGIYRAKTALQNFKPSDLTDKFQPKKSETPDKTEVDRLFIELNSPDNTVVTEATFKVNGKTLPSTYIAITTEQNDYLIVPNELGSFSQEVSLIKGANILNVTVFKSNGEKVEKSLSVVYTTAQL